MTNENALVRLGRDKSSSTGNPDWVEVEFREFRAISDRAIGLLSREEDCQVAFRKSISGLESDDLVGFANSKSGGAILIGVSRTKRGTGRRKAALVGCTVGDRERLKILAKSNQCVPPVPVSIFVENCSGKPFYRIEISSGPDKPYCTSGGTYKIRGDGRNEMLYPPQLLALFLEAEGREFVRWFQRATTSLGTAMQEANRRIRRSPARQFEAVSDAEGDHRDTEALPEKAGECDVRLSSQDLCGFLMRLP